MFTFGSVISVPSEDDGACGRLLEQDQAAQKRRLTGPGRADDDHVFSGADVLGMSSSTRWSPNDLDRCLTSITLTQPPFEHAQQLGKQHDEQQIHQRDAEQREQALIRLGDDRLGSIRHLLAADDRDERRILEQGDELIAERGQDVLDRLRDEQ